MSLNQYTAVNREAIWAALFAWFQSQLGGQFQTMGRKHVAPPDLTIADQPAFFQVAGKEVHFPRQSTFSGMPVRLQLKGFLILYLFDASPDEDIGQEQLLAETTLNGMLKAIDAALTPDMVPSLPGGEGKFTLGGLVTHCWIEGDSDLDPGIFGPQCAAIVPINILV
jgi:hypothetical protein